LRTRDAFERVNYLLGSLGVGQRTEASAANDRHSPEFDRIASYKENPFRVLWRAGRSPARRQAKSPAPPRPHPPSTAQEMYKLR